MKSLPSYQFLELSQDELINVNGGGVIADTLSVGIEYVTKMVSAITNNDPAEAAEATAWAAKAFADVLDYPPGELLPAIICGK
ncbi:hypothetical protein [Chitinophaga polysaccharea]|uniref:hypothetical protein n=1 Tax=Chitinophaga polysaccharea TaxID=1293035 RepID=UPI001159A26A|nr:hypothetical protein [Chitinophaga polysaccharea]